MSDRRAIGRRVEEVHAARRRLLGAPAILADLDKLDEARLGRRRLASEERRYRRLVDELENAPGPSEGARQ